MQTSFCAVVYAEVPKVLTAIAYSFAYFLQPQHTPNMYTFKGGTCLSKAYNTISRFSEDVDITINPLLANNLDSETMNCARHLC